MSGHCFLFSQHSIQVPMQYMLSQHRDQFRGLQSLPLSQEANKVCKQKHLSKQGKKVSCLLPRCCAFLRPHHRRIFYPSQYDFFCRFSTQAFLYPLSAIPGPQLPSHWNVLHPHPQQASRAQLPVLKAQRLGLKAQLPALKSVQQAYSVRHLQFHEQAPPAAYGECCFYLCCYRPNRLLLYRQFYF